MKYIFGNTRDTITVIKRMKSWSGLWFVIPIGVVFLAIDLVALPIIVSYAGYLALKPEPTEERE